VATEQLVLDQVPNSARGLAIAGIGALGLGAGLIWYFDPTTAGFFPYCPLLRFTGFACPGCGLTRGFHALLHGDVMTALDFNALIPLFVFILGYLVASLLSLAIRGRAIVGLERNLVFLWILVGVLITFGVLRNLPFYPFTILFP
jgi:hypothetical protein